MNTIKFLGDFIGGQFRVSENPDGEWSIQSPSDLKDMVFQPAFALNHIDEVCSVAKKAFPKWAALSQEERNSYLMRLKEVYLSRLDEMAEVISRETGKPTWEAKSEAQLLASKIDVTLNHSMKLVAEERIANAIPNVDGVIRFRPRGVMAVLGPFNFPAHLPNGHIIPALAVGNTVVFKPSDKTPAVGQKMAEFFQQAGFPEGVFNLLQGQAETGKRLAGHELVDGVLFTGSYEVGLRIKQDTLQHAWKLLALEMGGKNATVVWKDADLKKALYETVVGSFMTSGQRCSCTSRLILHRSIADQFIAQLHEAAKRLTIGHWKQNVFMGPLISSDAVEKYLRFQEIAKREGAEPVMRGKALELEWKGHYVTPSIYTVKKFDPQSVYQKSEIFGPNVAVYVVDDFEEAMHINNSTGFGLVMALFSKDEALYKKAILEARVGLLNWNRTTNGASSRLPFGGLGKSGNDRPSAHFAVQYCAVPMASLEDKLDFNPQGILPGMNFEV